MSSHVTILASLAILLCGIFDRLRGAGADSITTWMTRVPWIVLYGASLAWLLGARSPSLIAVVAAMWWMGSRPGWQSVLSAVFEYRYQTRWERWQRGWLCMPASHAAENVSLAVRGLIWGAPLLVLAPWLPGALVLVPLAGLAFLGAPLLVRNLPISYGTRWALMEFSRGMLMGAAALAAGAWA